MAVIVTCDNCGDRIPHKEVCEVVVVTPKQGGRDPVDLMSIINGSQLIRREHFQFCGECAAMLALAIKSRKIKRRKGELLSDA